MKEESKIKFNIRTKLGRKLTPIVGIAVAISLGLFILDFGLLKKQCNKENEVYCTASTLANNFANDVLIALIGMIGFDRFLHGKTIEEVRKIFQATQGSQYISYVNPDTSGKNEYKTRISDAINKSSKNSKFKIICLSETISCLDEISSQLYTQKIQDGCEFQILTMHPSCPILSCIKARSNDEIEHHNSRIHSFGKKIDKISDKALRIRYTKNLYSSYSLLLCESNGIRSTLLWMRSMIDDNEYCYPLLEFTDRASVDQLEKQFDILWNKSLTAHNLQTNKMSSVTA